MKKLLILFVTILTFALAAEADTSSTSIKLSDFQYFSIKSQDKALLENKIETPLKPFSIIQAEDKWFSKDKWKHFTSAYFLTIQSHYSLNKMFYISKKDARNVSIGLSLSLSLGKELYDVFEKKSIFSWKDLCYDVLGTGLAYYTIELLNQ